ncbi:MAG: DUF58 domain-containing protein [Nanoarchaeota archaeon]
MKTEKHLNVDIAGSISEFQSVMKEFMLKNKLYRILLRGKGLEFEAFRRYIPGEDDASYIDWKTSRRANNLIVKQYKDERNLKIVFMVDIGNNMVFGSTKKLKCEYATEVVAAFAYMIISSGDKVGLLLFSDKVKKYIPPGGGINHFNRLMAELKDPNNYEGYADIKAPLEFGLDYITKSVSSVILVSDFISFDQDSIRDLSLLGSKFETVALKIRDPVDKALPNLDGEVVIEDPKTGQQMLINPKIVNKVYEQIVSYQEKVFRDTCRKNAIDLLELSTNDRFVPALSEFLRGRTKERKIK